MGRRPKPAKIRKIEGNAGKRSIPDSEPGGAVADLSNPPERLRGEALSEWRRVAGIHGGVIREIDRSIFEAYCDQWGLYLGFLAEVEDRGGTYENGAGAEVRAPWVISMEACLKLVMRFGNELGIGPASRSGVAAVSDKKVDDEEAAKVNLVFGGGKGT